MPITQSAKKALRQNRRRREMNLDRKKKLQTALKQFRKIAAAGNAEETMKSLAQAYKVIDKMKKTGFVKRGKADRLKSRLAKKLPRK